MSFHNRSTEQRRDALIKANGVRLARATLKGELKMGTTRVADVLEHPPAYVLKMKVQELLLAVPKIGMVKVTKVLNDCHVSPNKTVGGLSDRQRRELVRSVQRARVGRVEANRAPGTSI